MSAPSPPGTGPEEPHPPTTRGGARLGATLQRKALTPRRAAGIIASYTMLATVLGGVLVWLVDRRDFDSLGEGLWWSLQTVTTVGYGDVTPTDTSGRVIGAFVMVSGIAFLTVITAAVTAALIETARRRLDLTREFTPSEQHLQEIAARLSAIEQRLDERDARARAEPGDPT